MIRRFCIYSLTLAILGVLLMVITGYKKDDRNKIVSDYDGNIYHTVTIGSQTWMIENLKTTHYRNGDPIPNVTEDEDWRDLASGAYCNYDNDTNNASTYGRLYNRWAVTDNRNICPAGWHVPDSEEWAILETYLGGSEVAGGKMKEAGTIHWLSPNTGATGESNFSALPGGYRFRLGHFAGLGITGYWWSSSRTPSPWFRLINYSEVSINRPDYTDVKGLSVRCIKD